MSRILHVEMTQTADQKPLAVVKNFPGLDAEMTPAELRTMGQWLIDAADECEDRPAFRKHLKSYTITFGLES